MKRGHQVYKGWLWMAGYFLLLILASNHSHGYSFLDSFLDDIGIGSWSKEAKTGWHITSLISIPLLLLCLYQTVRGLKERYPRILMIMIIATFICSFVYPKFTEGIF
ncbi:hypothetical protein [Paenibacillus rubinfantis]|jgi:hypothetical protein|uniref:hypothetical protein n=1 Tax=Paenibacillus rubinfantis TaxID=1720296 RepID=UPI00073F6C83|nr:hypothetical protein [Paenibacillus rubinfantis]